jgi:hypothetical protein
MRNQIKPRVKTSYEVLEHIDPTKPVRVYRNLHKKCLSVKQGIVRCHADNVALRGCRFIVSKAGQKRVRREKRKNVHAFVEGVAIDHVDIDVMIASESQSCYEELYYNPYKCDGFTNTSTGLVVRFADYARIGPTVLAYHILHDDEDCFNSC